MEREQKALQDKYDSELRKKTSLEADLRMNENELEELKRRAERLEENYRQSEAQLEELKKKEEEYTNIVSDAKNQVEHIQNKLDHINRNMGDAKVDRHEDERRKKKTEIVEQLKKLYPGVYDRSVMKSIQHDDF